MLAELDVLLAASRSGGRIAWLTGEAGIGKSTLVRRFAERHEGRARVLLGSCHPAAGRVAGQGPWRDIAQQAGLDADAANCPVRLADELVAAGPELVVVLEDLQWADGADVDMLTAIGRRLERCRALFLTTCRGGQAPPDHALNAMLASLPPDAVTYLAVPPLSPREVAELALRAGHPSPELYGLSGGNPLLTNEILAFGPNPGESSRISTLAVSRMAELRPAARDVARLVAVAPDGVEPWLLEALGVGDAEAPDECLASGLLVRRSGQIDFRHGILKQVVHDLMPLFARRTFHRDLLRALVSHPDRPGVTPLRLVFHALGCDDSGVIRRHAPRAARDAVATGGRDEAIRLYELALRHTDPLDGAGRGELLDALAEQAYLIGDLRKACSAGRDAAAAWEAAARADRAGPAQRRLARALWLTGNRTAAQEAARRAAALLSEQGCAAQLALAHAELSRLEALVPHAAPALTLANLAIRAADRATDPRAGAAALIALGSAKLARGETDGRAAVARGWSIALEHGLADEAGRAAAALAGHDLAHRAHASAAAVLDDALRVPIAIAMLEDARRVPAAGAVFDDVWRAPDAAMLDDALRLPTAAAMLDDALRAPAVGAIFDDVLRAPGAAVMFDDARRLPAAAAALDDVLRRLPATGATLDDVLRAPATGATFDDVRRASTATAPPHCSGQLLALRSWLRLSRGDWSGAQADAGEAIRRITFPSPTSVPALSTLARLRARRGLPAAAEAAHRAVQIAESAGELQAVVLAAVAEAEHFWLSDRETLRVDHLVAAFGQAWRARHPWFTGELAWWLRRAGTPTPTAPWFAEPYRHLLADEWHQAAQAWATLGCTYEQAEALACSNTPDDLSLALNLFDTLGAIPHARRLRRRLRQYQGLRIQRGPRPAATNHPAGLTTRQAEVLQLLSAGLSNAAIAERLSVSIRTAEHHVAAILTKLAVTSRRHAADAAARMGLRPAPPETVRYG